MVNRQAWELGNRRSCIRELFAYGRAQAEQYGEEAVCDFSLGNPATPPPAEVRRALTEITLTEDPMTLHGYTPAEGAPATRAAIAASLNRRFGAGVRARDLFLTAGAAPALTATFAALTASKRSEFIAIAPFFPEYSVFSGVWGAELKVAEADEPDFQINMEALSAALTPETQGVIVNSPNNPTGAIYTRHTLEALARLLREREEQYGHPIYLICDEPYRELVYDGKEVPYLPALYADTVVCYSYSKSLSLPGDRIGYVLVPPAAADHDALLAAVAGAARAIGHVCAPATYQRLIADCTDAQPDLAFYDKNRRLLYEALTSYGYSCVYPDGAFYLFCRAPAGDAAAFSERAKAKNVLVVPCGDFGAPGYVRIAYCVDEKVIRRALPLFRALIEEGKA
jgi:aspartate aminotransferase